NLSSPAQFGWEGGAGQGFATPGSALDPLPPPHPEECGDEKRAGAKKKKTYSGLDNQCPHRSLGREPQVRRRPLAPKPRKGRRQVNSPRKTAVAPSGLRDRLRSPTWG